MHEFEKDNKAQKEKEEAEAKMKNRVEKNKVDLEQAEWAWGGHSRCNVSCAAWRRRGRRSGRRPPPADLGAADVPGGGVTSTAPSREKKENNSTTLESFRGSISLESSTCGSGTSVWCQISVLVGLDSPDDAAGVAEQDADRA